MFEDMDAREDEWEDKVRVKGKRRARKARNDARKDKGDVQ